MKFSAGHKKLSSVSGLLYLIILVCVVFEYLVLRYIDHAGLTVSILVISSAFLVLVFLIDNKFLKKSEIVNFILVLTFFVAFGPFYGNSSLVTLGSIVYGSKILAFYLMAKFICIYGLERWFSLGSWLVLLISYLFYVHNSDDIFAQGYFSKSSYNMISASFIVLAACIILVFRAQKYLSFFVVFATFVICFFLYARSSMLISGLLLLWWALFNISFRFFVSLFFLILLVVISGGGFWKFIARVNFRYRA